jgi:cellulose synthase/poly-beta-1,6-N-acetylglucosamine synthase-like glycosyltransferase
MLVWLELPIFIYFSFVTGYSLLFSIAGLFYRSPRFVSKPTDTNYRIAVLIPSYKEDSVIINVAKQALKQTYPTECFDVIVIADSLQEATIDELKKSRAIVHEVHFEKSTKVKSLQSALNQYSNYEIAVILDADNVMEDDFLKKINLCYNNGWSAIQGQRSAKNKNTPLAILDGLSEAIANHINRQGPIAIGLSSPIIGSGMAFQFNLVKNILNTMDSIGGFDKELQLKVLEGGTKIHYLKDGIVLDEKVDNTEVFQNQRKRWMSSHYIYFRKFFGQGIRSLLHGNISIFNIAILSNIQLPRMMNLGLLTIVTLLCLLLRNFLSLPYWYWLVLLSLYALSFLLAIPKSYFNKSFLMALLSAPKAFFTVFTLHFKLKGANKKFIHTPHKQL